MRANSNSILLLQQQLFGLVLLSSLVVLQPPVCGCEGRASAVGDPGMRRDGLRVAIEAWNQCNEVGEEAPNMGSPRKADCFDIINSTNHSMSYLPFPSHLLYYSLVNSKVQSILTCIIFPKDKSQWHIG